VKAAIKARGIESLDGRTVAYKAVKAWRCALLADLGGESNVSTQKLAIVDAAARTKLFIDHLDSWLLVQPSLVNGRRKAVLPVLRERQILVDSLARLLTQIGLERRARTIGTLQQYIAARSKDAEPLELATAKGESV
jgi:hypothetical protein